MTKQDYASVLYDGNGGLRGLARAADEAASRGGAGINVLLLHSRKSPAKEMCEWAPDDRRPDAALTRGKAVMTLSERGKDPIRIAVVRSGRQPNVYYALSDCTSADFRARFVSLLDDHVPTISRPYLSNAEMRSIVGAAAESCDARVRLVSTRSRRPGHEGFDSRVDHVDRTAEEFVGAGGGEGCEIRTVGLACRPRVQAGDNVAGGPKALTVTRDCRFTARRGTDALFGSILPRAADLAAGRAEMLRACAKTARRRISDQLIVKFKERVFADPGKKRARVDAIASMPYTAIIDHPSMFFIHITMVDYGDCSTYGIYVLSGDTLSIIPSLSASDASMSRLVNHVMEKFGDATIEKYGGGS